MVRVRPSPKEKILELVKKEPGITRVEVAARLGVTYWSSRYWLEKLVEEKFLRKEVEFYISGYVRRVRYFPIIALIYYRTQFAILFYAIVPRPKTPDPIAEMRVTAVSNVKGKYRLEEFERACIYTGVILAPQTYWIKQQFMVTADETDEPIDADELAYSVTVYKKLNYCERYAVFFRSRRDKDSWREEHGYYWTEPSPALPAPREGDFEYAEDFIKALENKKILLGVLKVKFDNSRGEVESVEV